MLGFFGKKVSMTTLINKYTAVPVTVLDISENVVAAKRELEDGRKAVIIGVGKKKKPTKAEKGAYKELGYVPVKLKQFIVEEDFYNKFNVGDVFTKEVINDLLGENARVDVTGISKGKGFAGVIKRWGFHRQPRTHGQSDRERHPGAIGAQTPGRVFKGKKMAGHMGNEQVTIKNLQVVDLLEEGDKLYLVVKGGVPGAYKNFVIVKIK